jgi:type I restriction enzyme, S subunit
VHWEVKKLKYVFDSKNTIRVPLNAEERGNMENKIYDYYGASGVIDFVDNYLFDEETILIGEDGANLLTRSKRLAFIARGKYWVNNHAHILKPKNGNIEYLCELLELIDYTEYVSGSAQPKLTQEALMSINIFEPPIEEQNLIFNFLKMEFTRIDTIISKAEQEITLLKEYKTALISEVVTGKVKVI